MSLLPASFDADAVVDRVVHWYLSSGDFNGLPLSAVLPEGVETPEARRLIADLISSDRLTAAFETWDLNPHILHHPRSPEVVADAIRGDTAGPTCLYPTPTTMAECLDVASFGDRPFTRLLALGTAQLEPTFFELTVLDRYLLDPRYLVEFHDYTGWLSITDAAARDGLVPERDQVSIQTFGLAYRPNGFRCLVVPVRYLSGLSPEHQRYWETYRIEEACRVARDYVLQIMGEWPEGISLYQALLEEQVVVNEMARAMGRTPLFRREFHRDRPREFGLFTLPTRRAYRAFVLLLDHLLSENLDTAFFGGDVPLVDDQGARRPSLHLLEDWLRARFRPAEGDPAADVVGPLRAVRRERMRPAHVYEADAYDPTLYDAQDRLIEQAYGAMRTLRLILENHPATAHVAVPTELREGRFTRF